MQIETTNEFLNEVVPVRNLTVKIQGLAIFKLGEEKQWKLFFPKAPNHPFKIKIKKKIGALVVAKSECVLPTATVIDFLPDGKNAGGGLDNSVTTDTVDISEMHKRFHHEKVTFSDDIRNYAGFLKLNGTTLVSELADEQKTFEIWDVIGGTKTKVGERTLGNILVAGFTIDPNEMTKIKVKNALGFDLNLSYQEEGVEYEVTFFNDCEGMDCGDVSDFRFFYNIIDTQRLKGKFEFVSPVNGERTPQGGCSPGQGDGMIIPNSITDFIA